MKRLRVVVVGAGHLGRIHARLLKTVESVEVVGVVDPVADARHKVTDELGLAAYAHLYEVLGKIDAAIVATPTCLHHGVALELLRSGVHCLVEKPICLTTGEAEDLIAAAAAQRLVLQVGHVERFNPALAALPDEPGEIRMLEARRTSGYTFRSTDVGVVLDLMIHDIDLALVLAGGSVIDVQASGLAVIGPNEDIAEARLTFDSGCVAVLKASRVSPVAERKLNVYCERWHASLDLAARTAQIVRPKPELQNGEIDVRDLLPLESVQIDVRNAILDEQHDFVRGIVEGHPVRVPGEAGRDALAIAEAILEQIAAQSEDRSLVAPTLPITAVSRFPRLAEDSTGTALRRAG